MFTLEELQEQAKIQPLPNLPSLHKTLGRASFAMSQLLKMFEAVAPQLASDPVCTGEARDMIQSLDATAAQVQRHLEEDVKQRVYAIAQGREAETI